MKKVFCLILFAAIMQIICDDKDDASFCFKEEPSDVEECEKLKAKEGYHCCFWEYEKSGKTVKICNMVSNENYDNIKDYISQLEDSATDGSSDLSIDCSSNYIAIPLLLLILLFL